MLLRGNELDAKRMIGLGQACLLPGLLCTTIAGLSRIDAPWARSLPLGDFALGFLAGFGSILLGVSIVLNVRGMVLSRRQQG